MIFLFKITFKILRDERTLIVSGRTSSLLPHKLSSSNNERELIHSGSSSISFQLKSRVLREDNFINDSGNLVSQLFGSFNISKEFGVPIESDNSCHQCDDFPCKFNDNFPVPIDKKVILRAIPTRKERGT